MSDDLYRAETRAEYYRKKAMVARRSARANAYGRAVFQKQLDEALSLLECFAYPPMWSQNGSEPKRVEPSESLIADAQEFIERVRAK